MSHQERHRDEDPWHEFARLVERALPDGRTGARLDRPGAEQMLSAAAAISAAIEVAARDVAEALREDVREGRLALDDNGPPYRDYVTDEDARDHGNAGIRADILSGVRLGRSADLAAGTAASLRSAASALSLLRSRNG